MQRLILFLVCLGLLQAQTDISGIVGGHWTLAGSPYRITGNVLVPMDSALYVSQDVEVIFQGSHNLSVTGEMHVIGAWIHGPGTILCNGTLRLNTTALDSLMRGVVCTGGLFTSCHCLFRYSGESGLTLDGVDSARVCTAIFSDNQMHGVKIRQADSVRIEQGYFTRNGLASTGYPALYLDGASPQRLRQNWFEDNHGAAIGVWNTSGPAFPAIRQNMLRGNYRGIDIYHASPILEDNIILDNGVAGNPASGDGIRVIGEVGTGVLCNRNYIAGNHYGVRNLETNAINLGDMVNDWPGDDGENFLAGNLFDGETWNVWNGAPDMLMAQNNFWPGLDLEEVDATLRDDDEGVGGEVVFEPVYALIPPVADLNVDSTVDIRDLVLAVETALPFHPEGLIPTAAHYYQADLNGDWHVDVQDMLDLVAGILGTVE